MRAAPASVIPELHEGMTLRQAEDALDLVPLGDGGDVYGGIMVGFSKKYPGRVLTIWYHGYGLSTRPDTVEHWSSSPWDASPWSNRLHPTTENGTAGP